MEMELNITAQYRVVAG